MFMSSAQTTIKGVGKTCLILGIWTLAVASSYAQYGMVHFDNTFSGPLMTNGPVTPPLPPMPVSDFKVTLYYALYPFPIGGGQTGPTTMGSEGNYNGGLVALFPYAPFTSVYMQVLAWSPSTYPSYYAAVSSGDPSVLVGASTMAYAPLGFDTYSAPYPDQFGDFILDPAPIITTSSPLSAGVTGTSYSKTLAASGGTTPYTWSIVAGGLPAVLTLSSGGVISGTPGAVTNASFTVQVTGNNGLSSTKAFSLTIVAPPVGDGFNNPVADTNKWGSDIHAGPGGQLVQTNGQLQFLGSNTVVRPWIGSFGSYTQDWELTLDMNLSNVALSQDNSQVRIGLSVADLGGWFTAYGTPLNSLESGLGLRRLSGQTYRAFGAQIRTNDVMAAESMATTTNQHASVRVTFAAATKTLSTWYDASGNTNAHTWTELSAQQINTPPIDWGMTNCSAFGFALVAEGDGYIVNASDQVYVDNFVLTGSVPAPPAPASLGDDFNFAAPDPDKWGPDMHMGPGGTLVLTNGQLQFLGTDAAIRPWIGSYGSYTQDWQVTLDVNLGNAVLTQNASHAQVALVVVNQNDPVAQYGLPGDNFSIALDLYRDSGGLTERSFEAYLRTNWAEIYPRAHDLTAAQHASLRISFSASSKTLTAWYNTVGSGNACNWTLLQSARIDAAGSNWGMGNGSPFGFAAGVGCGSYTVSASDQVYADNFTVIGSVPAFTPMVFIPAGSFQMGNNNTNELWYQFSEYPEHPVYVSAFRADRCEVSNEQMRRVLQWAYDNGRIYADSSSVTNLEGDRQRLMVLNNNDCRITFSGGYFLVVSNMGNFPCAEVTWYGAQAYCNYKSDMEDLPRCINFTNWACDFSKDGYRLPTESEWEKAARGGLTGQYFPWPSYGGSYSNHIDGTQANYLFSGDPYSGRDASNDLPVTPVGYYNGRQVITNQAGQLLPGQDMTNGYGLYDMAGNVYEWCYDWADAFWYRQAGATNKDTTGPLVGSTNILGYLGRVIRGGSWEELPDELRCAARGANEPGDKGNGIGFRAVRTVDAGTPTNSTPLIPIINGLEVLSGSVFGFKVSGPAGLVAIIEASTNLVSWVPIQTNALVNGEVRFYDPQSAAFLKRFYRARFVYSSSASLLLQPGVPGPSVANATFGFYLSGMPNQTVVVEASTNLTAWTAVGTNSLLTGYYYFSEFVSTNFSRRFYRVRAD